ncbi:MAG: hypothetical protein RLZZ546_2178 [Bacteroidota bacterium]|jgi:Fur family ferric uptake transcriptional regulator
MSHEVFKKAKIKNTPIRNQILEIFNRANYALSHGEIEAHFEDIDRITLYRTLKTFEEKGVIHKITDLSGVSKYALCESKCVEHHHHLHHAHLHFQCEVCNNTFCIENVEIPKITLPSHFLVTGQSITMTGKCTKCH